MVSARSAPIFAILALGIGVAVSASPPSVSVEDPCVQTDGQHELEGISATAQFSSPDADHCLSKCRANYPQCLAAVQYDEEDADERVCRLYDNNVRTSADVRIMHISAQTTSNVTVFQLFKHCLLNKENVSVKRKDNPVSERRLARDPPTVLQRRGWGPWSQWSECSGYGQLKQKTRTRKCSSYSCYGPKEERQPCQQAVWTEWGPWSNCDATCGDGKKVRHRSCQYGTTCYGPREETKPCAAGPCCQWSHWAGYGTCSATCNGGTKRRTRKCEGSGYGGAGCQCPGESEHFEPCGEEPCCEWGQWSGYAVCSATCGGGNQLRTRKCKSHGSYGGNVCQCYGEPEQNQPCGTDKCCEWGQWNSYATCSATCGGGIQKRTRQCKSHGSYGSNVCQCYGEPEQKQPCAQEKCCEWGQWNSYAPCSATCGSGIQKRTRKCNTFGSYGAQQCQCYGEAEQNQPCEAKKCCEWGPWGYWSGCSTTCGRGEMFRSRKCSCYSCPYGQPKQSKPCDNPPCGYGYGYRSPYARNKENNP